MSSSTIGTGYIQIVPTTKGIKESITSEMSSAGSVGGKSFSSGFSGAVGTGLKAGVAGIAALGTAAIGAGTALTSAASSTAQYGDNIDKMSQKLGVSSSFYQEWDAVLQHSGTSMDSMGATFKKLATASQNASADQEKAFKQLGLSMQEVQSMSTEELFTSVVSGLQGMEEGSERTALATQLLGRGAMEMGALFNTSAEDTQAMIDTVNNLGGVMSGDSVKNAAAFQDSLQDLQTAFSGVQNAAISELLPSFTTIMDGFTQLISGSDGAEETIASGFEQLIGNIQSGLPSLVSGLTSGLGAIMQVAPELLQTLATAILDAIPMLLPTLIQLVSDIGDFIIQNLPLIIEAGLQLILQLATALTDALPTLIPAIYEVVFTIFEYLVNNVDLLIDASIQLMIALAEGFAQAIPILVQKAPIIIGSLLMALLKAIPKLLEAGKQCIIIIKDGLDNAKEILFNKMTVLIGTLKTKAVSKIKEFIEVGKNIVNGIKDGLAEAWDNLVGWFKEKIDGLKDLAKGVLDINSPSKVFADEVGQYIPSGIAQGIQNGMGVLDKAIDSMALSTVEGSIGVESSIASARYNPSNTATSSADASSILSVLSTYLPQIAQGGNVTIKLEGDASRLFRMMQTEQRRNTELVGI